MLKKIFCTIVVGLSIISSATAQHNICDSLTLVRAVIKQIENENAIAVTFAQRKSTYTKYLAANVMAASLAERCFTKYPAPLQSVEALKNNYLLGKFFYQCGDCDKATGMFNTCLANPNCGTQKIGNANYAQIISRAFTSCNTQTPREAVVNPYYIINYSGKGGAYIGNLFNSVDTALYNNMPLTAVEIEEIAARAIDVTMDVNAEVVKKLSGNDQYVLHPPFLFMHAGGGFMTIQQQKNLDTGKKAGNSLNIKDYSKFVISRYNDLQKIYFNKPLGQGLIQVYLMGGDYDSAGLTSFLRFCNTVHKRAYKKVAYFMKLDNSIVAWTSSGGGSVIHETIHALIDAEFPGAPLWVNEGLASLYEEVGSNGEPLNNYRLQYIKDARVYIKIRDLMGIDKYHDVDEHNYNLLMAYSRYFCKFIYDSYGENRLAEIYKQLRDNKVTADSAQLRVVLDVTGKTEDELQKEWQLYVNGQDIPQKWQRLSWEISNDNRANISYVFHKSDVVTDIVVPTATPVNPEEDKPRKHQKRPKNDQSQVVPHKKKHHQQKQKQQQQW